jgi:hypothetical protein
MIAVMGIVKETMGNSSAVQKGATVDLPFNQMNVSNNVAGAFPVVVEAADWLAYRVGPNNDKWIYANYWFACEHFDREKLIYKSVVTDEALIVWDRLSYQQRVSVVNACGL